MILRAMSGVLGIFVLGALVCAAPGMDTSAKSKDAKIAAAKKPEGPQPPTYVVYARKQGETQWKEHKVYATGKEANQAAESLSEKGLETEVHAKTAMLAVPRRATVGGLPANLTVSQQQAQQAFQKMAAQRDIAFRYPVDGCYARAHLMIQRMQQQGLKPYRVWTFANGEMLRAKTSNAPSGYVEWRYHVAPILRVRQQNGVQSWMVIDPSLFQQPVPINQWQAAQKRPNGRYNPYVTLTRLGQAPKDQTGNVVPGSGYWPGPDPREGVQPHAVKTMARYKQLEPRLSLRLPEPAEDTELVNADLPEDF